MNSSWWELQILSDVNLEDAIFWRLEQIGCHGTASQKKDNICLIRAYLPQGQVQPEHLSALSPMLSQDALNLGLEAPKIRWQSLAETDWASSWKQHWHPQEIGDRFLINPAWLPTPANSERLVLRLDPGTAFGTGNHATTQLCLEALEMRLDEDAQDLVIADIGCGSGILSIGALLLGASKVYAVDTDALAISSTQSNCELNQIEPQHLIVEQGSIEVLTKLITAPVDGIVCNILAEVIVKLVPQLNAIAKPTTWGVLSGILHSQTQVVADALEKNGWIVATIWRRQEWCCFNIRRL